MQKRYWILIFLAVLFIHIAGILAGWMMIEQVTKIFLVPCLVGYFTWSTKPVVLPIKKWLLLALFFSWIGDILLMFVSNDAIFFLAGLASFLVAHIFYIILFHLIRIREKVESKPILLLPVLIYYILLMTLLSTHLGDMKLPVRIYGVVICFMLMLAAHMFYIRNKRSGILMLTGALLFVLSDSILAINKFYDQFAAAGVLIMLTYGIAQLLITEGLITYLNKESNSDQ